MWQSSHGSPKTGRHTHTQPTASAELLVIALVLVIEIIVIVLVLVIVQVLVLIVMDFWFPCHRTQERWEETDIFSANKCCQIRADVVICAIQCAQKRREVGVVYVPADWLLLLLVHSEIGINRIDKNALLLARVLKFQSMRRGWVTTLGLRLGSNKLRLSIENATIRC